MNRIYANDDGQMCMDLSTLEIEWLDAMEQLDDENLAAIFVAWEIESTDRMARNMMSDEDE